MKNKNITIHIKAVLFSLCAAVFVLWLSSDYRSSGFLGFLQVSFKPIMLIPYLLGTIFGSAPHNPNVVVVFITLVAQFYLIWWLFYFVTVKEGKKKKGSNLDL